MENGKLQKYIKKIKPLDKEAVGKARERLENLAKPPGSLGKLEDIAAMLAGITGNVYNDVSKRCVIVMSADNGVFEEGVASTPQEVTYSQTINLTRGLTGAAVIAKHFGADMIVTDVGVNADIKHPAVIDRKIRKSTWNIKKGAAMTYDEAEHAVLTGIETAEEAVRSGYRMIGVGEMGIANTTTSSAVLCALTGVDAERVTGKGAGLSDEAFSRKIDVIKTALKVNQPDASDALDVLAKVGGFDIAAMAGVFLGCAIARVPVVIDGFISMVAALAAVRIAPLSKEFMLASHVSYEQGYMYASQSLGVEPSLHLNMRLGEGSGCPIMFAVVDAACSVIRDMATFGEAEIDDKYIEEIRSGDYFEVK